MEEQQQMVTIYTDGACSGNPGPGGYAAVLLYGDKRLELSQGYRKTTNNRMELLAVITALERLSRPCRVNLYSDSEYVVNAITKGWLESWQRKGWRKADKKPVLNVDLWQRLLPQIQKQIEYLHLNGNIERRNDFVSNQDLRIHHQGPRNAYALTLSSAELVRIFAGVRGAQPDRDQATFDLLMDLTAAEVAGDLQALPDQVANGHPRIE